MGLLFPLNVGDGEADAHDNIEIGEKSVSAELL